MSDTSSAGNTAAPVRGDRVRKQVEDALELANFAVSTGAKSADGQPLQFDDIERIQSTAAHVGLLDIPVNADDPLDWNKFEKAYHSLASAMSPVTADTLRDTRDTARAPGDSSRPKLFQLHEFIWGYSPAQRFARGLWALTFALVIAIIVLEWAVNYLGLKKDAAAVASWRFLWQSLVPWTYGALGACAYMLRSAHFFIHQRTFDTRRTPEYFNRILLGAISGGGIILFTEYLTSADDGSVAHLGAAALGFVAGYSGDLLFNLVERVVTAIFPKTPEDDARKAAAAGNKSPEPQNGEPDPADKTGNKPVDQIGTTTTTQ